MTDQPYTDTDLRAEAISCLSALTEDPDFMGVGEAMQDAYVDSTRNGDDGTTWGELLPYEADGGEAYNTAQRRIHDLINGAADVSEWAVNLGADGLQPDGHTLQLGVDPGNGDKPRVRLHFAFAPDMPDDDRDRFVMRLSKTILANL